MIPMPIDRLRPVSSSLRPSNHPYLNGAWTPLHEEVTADELTVIEGRIPDDIDGVYLRNTENQLRQPLAVARHSACSELIIHDAKADVR
jgi:carotenoid cleavage dioxygenase-like enzyme